MLTSIIFAICIPVMTCYKHADFKHVNWNKFLDYLLLELSIILNMYILLSTSILLSLFCFYFVASVLYLPLTEFFFT